MLIEYVFLLSSDVCVGVVDVWFFLFFRVFRLYRITCNLGIDLHIILRTVLQTQKKKKHMRENILGLLTAKNVIIFFTTSVREKEIMFLGSRLHVDDFLLR